MKKETYDQKLEALRTFPQDDKDKALAAIWHDLDGQEWNADTAEYIANTLRTYGMSIDDLAGNPDV